MPKTPQVTPEWNYAFWNGRNLITKNKTDIPFEDSLLSRIQNDDKKALKKLTQKMNNGERIRLW